MKDSEVPGVQLVTGPVRLQAEAGDKAELAKPINKTNFLKNEKIMMSGHFELTIHFRMLD